MFKIWQDEMEGFPARQLAVLALCRFSEPIAFESILAYSYEMVKGMTNDPIVATSPSFYAALLIAAYAGAEAASAVYWGRLSDRIGRKPVCLLGLCGVALSCLVFGLTNSYWIAFAARILGGALNGNVAVMQTMVMEVVHVPEHEPLAYAIQPFMWSFGGMIGTSMGGFLARPADFYPRYFSHDGLFGRFPYLLPNLVCVVVIVTAVIQGIFLLDETHPVLGRPEPKSIGDGEDSDGAACESADSGETSPLLPAESTPQVPGTEIPGPDRRVYTYPVIMVIVVLVAVNCQLMSVFTLFPIYLLDPPESEGLDLVGGLGLSLHDVGTFMSVNAFSVLLIQGLIVPRFISAVGPWKTFVYTTIACPLTYLAVPLMRLLPEALSPLGTYASMALPSSCGIIAMPAIFILLRNACPRSEVLGQINGMTATTTCGIKVVFSSAVGWVYGEWGSGAAWLSLAIMGWVGACVMLWTPRDEVSAGRSAKSNNKRGLDESAGSEC